MKRIFEHDNTLLVNNAKNTLINAGIDVFLKNEHSSTGGHAQFASMELWVNKDSDFDQAQTLLSFISNPEQTQEWICSECDEKNDESFEICWSCQKEAS
jgi:hypothetical protein